MGAVLAFGLVGSAFVIPVSAAHAETEEMPGVETDEAPTAEPDGFPNGARDEIEDDELAPVLGDESAVADSPALAPRHADFEFSATCNAGEATITGAVGALPADLTIPEMVTCDGGAQGTVLHIGTGALSGNQLTTVNFPYTLNTVGIGAFSQNNLTHLTFPDSVTSIGPGAFQDNQLESVKLPDSLIEIWNWAFMNNALTSVTIPASVEVIYHHAFSRNPDLRSVIFEGNAPSWVEPGSPTGAFGEAEGKTFYVGENATGFSFPTWMRYTTGFTVTFDAHDGTAPTEGVSRAGHQLPSEVVPTPLREGYDFAGWFTDAEVSALYDFDTPVTGDFTLYAGWQATVPPDGSDSDGGGGDQDDTRPIPDDGNHQAGYRGTGTGTVGLASTGGASMLPLAGIAALLVAGAATAYFIARRKTASRTDIDEAL